MENSDCVFCKIIKGEERSSKIYEDDKILAFMDIRPISPGECMIIPKEHIDHFCDVPDELSQHIMLYSQKLARKIQKTFNPKRVGYVIHGFGVPHAHLVLIPLNERDDVTSKKFMEIQNGEIVLNFDKVPFRNYTELDKYAELLKI